MPLDRIAELQKLNALVLETFAKLVDNTTASANDEEERRRLLDKLAVIFPNMHHLLNEYRPHQVDVVAIGLWSLPLSSQP